VVSSSGILLFFAACAIVIGLIGLYIRGRLGQPKHKNERTAKQAPAEIDWNFVLSAEIQSCLPNRKIEAIKRYREHTGVGLKEAKDIIEYAMAHPEQAQSRMQGSTVSQPPKLKPHESGLDWDVLLLPEIQDALPDNKIEAIKCYREHTGVGLKEAKDAIEYFIEHRGEVPAKIRRYDLVDEQANGIRDMLRAGKRAEAQKIYQAFTGVDQFTASEAIDALEYEIATEVERYDRLHETNSHAVPPDDTYEEK
jgi:ribosomal protein L7/L12